MRYAPPPAAQGLVRVVSREEIEGDIVPLLNGPEDFGLSVDGDFDHSSPGTAAKQRFILLPFAEIKVDATSRHYLVKNLLASTGLAVIWGAPKCGKSFWAVDLGLHVALGWEYRGRRVQQATVVYAALEG